MAKTLDPLHITERTYKQFARLLDMLEDEQNTQEVTIPQLISALKALQSYDLAAVRRDEDDEPAGKAIRTYSRAFAANAAGGRAKATRRGAPAIAAVDSDDDTDTA